MLPVQIGHLTCSWSNSNSNSVKLSIARYSKRFNLANSSSLFKAPIALIMIIIFSILFCIFELIDKLREITRAELSDDIVVILHECTWGVGDHQRDKHEVTSQITWAISASTHLIIWLDTPTKIHKFNCRLSYWRLWGHWLNGSVNNVSICASLRMGGCMIIMLTVECSDCDSRMFDSEKNDW